MTSTPAGQQTDRGGRFPFGGHLTDLGYAAGWRVVRAMPEFMARNAFDAGAHYAARSGGPEQLRKNLARVIGVTPDRGAGRADSCFAGLIRAILAGGIPVAVDGSTRLGEQLDPHFAGKEHIAAALDAGRGAVLALPHSGNWDMAGVWLVWKLRHLHHRERAAQTRVAVQPVHRLPRKPRFRDAAADGRRAAAFRGTGGTAARQPPDVPDGRARPQPQRACKSTSSANPRACPPGPAKLAIETGARSDHRCTAGTHRTGGVSRCGRLLTRHPATSRSSRRSWPTGSPATSPPTRPTGT